MSNEEKSGLKHWVPAFVLMVCVVLAFFDKISIAVLFSDPHFQSSMGIAKDKAKLGWLMTSFLLAYGFSSVFLSFLGDIFNPKKMLFWSVTSWGLLMLCMGFTTSYSGMLILRVLLGLAEGPLFALAYTIVKQTYTDRQQARASTMFLLGTPIGAFLGFPITAAVLAHHDWHTTFFVMAALTLIAILSIVFGLRNLQLTTGRHLAHIAADKLITTSLELGGKSPTIVLPDADVELAAKGVAYGIFSSAGQACIAGSRLFIHSSLYDQFLTRLVEITKGLRVGHPEQEGVHLGPLVNDKHLQSVDRYVQLAKSEGGQVLIGGEALTTGDYAKGSYYLPTIITGLNNSAQTCQEEIFGPVLVVMKYDNEQDLIAQANDSCFGLAAGIWTESYRKAWRIARALEVGTVWINTYKKFSISAPFGGFKDSGIGREKGRLGILSYMQQKSIYMGLNEQPNPWCD